MKTSFALLALALALAPLCLEAFGSDWEEGSGKEAQKPVESNTKSNKFLLHGQVQHSEKLAPLGDSMQAGANFNLNSEKNAKYASSWFKIPLWFAGTFQSHETTIEFVKDYATGKSGRPNKTIPSAGVEMHGFQKDAHGDIWHYYVESGSSQSEQVGRVTFNNVDWYGPELVSAEKVVMRILATSLIVDKHSGIIVDSFRREDLKTYEPAGSDEIKVTYTSKSFDSHGNPRDLQDGKSIYRRVAAFQSFNQDNEKNYRQLFHDFLANEKLSELIPK